MIYLAMSKVYIIESWKATSLVFFTLLFCNTASQAHSYYRLDSGKLFLGGAQLQRGVIITDSKKLKSIAQSNPYAIQVDFGFLNNSQKAWNNCMCYSKTGLSFSYVNFKNDEKLGKAINLALYTEPYLYHSHRFQFSLRGGAGLSYLTRVYDAETNPENLFFSKPISFLLTLGTTASYLIHSTLNVTLSAQFSHISNGGTKYPNWGINYPTAGIGVEYQFNKQELPLRKHIPFSHRPWKLLAHSLAGRHLADGTKRIALVLNTGLVKQVSRVNGVGLGGDVEYDAVNKVLEERTGQAFDELRASLSLQHYFFYGDLLFGQQVAYYITSINPNESGKVYQRYFLTYRFNKHWYGGFSLKAHLGISDYLSFSIGRVVEF
jgi:hypothetical protein